MSRRRRRLDPNQDLVLEEVIHAEELLSISDTLPAPGVAAICSTKDGKWRSVAVHRLGSFSDPNIKLYHIYTYLKGTDSTIIVLSVPYSSKYFDDHIEESLEQEVHPARREYIKSIESWARPPNRNQGRMVELIITGEMELMSPPEEGYMAGNLKGELIPANRLGPVIRGALLGKTNRGDIDRKDPSDNKCHPVRYAVPVVSWRWNHIYLPTDGKCMVYFKGVITPDNITALTNIGDLAIRTKSISIHLENETDDSYVYASAILRVTVDGAERVSVADLRHIAEVLKQYGVWNLITGDSVIQAFQAFVPGAAPHPWWQRHSIYKPKETLEKLQSTLRTAGHFDGKIMLGVTTGNQVALLDPELSPTMALISPSKMGKNGVLALWSNQVTRNQIIVPLAQGVGEAAPHWVKQMGGSVLDLNLQDATTLWKEDPELQDGRGRPDVAAIRQKQNELHVEDRESIYDMMYGVAEKYRHNARVSFPLTFNYPTARRANARVMSALYHVVEAWIEIWSQIYSETGEVAMFVFHDVNSLTKAEADPFLGDIPIQASRSLGAEIIWLITNGRNHGFYTWLTTQGRGDLANIGTSGEQLNLIADLNRGYMDVDIFYPDGSPFVLNLNCTSPPSLSWLVKRREIRNGQEVLV